MRAGACHHAGECQEHRPGPTTPLVDLVIVRDTEWPRESVS